MPFFNNGINFPNLTTKGTPTTADILLLADAAAANVPKQCTVGALPFAPSAGLLPTTEVTGTSQAMTTNNKYISNNAGLVTLTLPTTAALGDLLMIIGKGAGGWSIAQGASQLIHLGSQVTTTGAGGSLASTNQYDSLTMVCTVANTTWTVLGSPQGTLSGV